MKKIGHQEQWKCRLSEARAYAKSVDAQAREAHDPTGDEMNDSVWMWFDRKAINKKTYTKEICGFQLTNDINIKDPVGIMTVEKL